MTRRIALVSSLLALSLGTDIEVEPSRLGDTSRAMKFGSPLLTTELSGGIGGMVGARSRGGVNYFRARVRPGNPKSPGQTTVRNIMSSISAAWRGTLTILQRAAWEAIAGPSSSGIDAYNKGNAVAMLAGNARVDTAPASATLAVDPVTSAVVVDNSASTIGFTVPAGWDGEARAAVFATAPQSPSRLSQQFNFLFVGATAADVTGATTVAIPASHPAFAAPVGKVVYVRIVPFPQADGTNLGKAGAAQQFRVTTTA